MAFATHAPAHSAMDARFGPWPRALNPGLWNEGSRCIADPQANGATRIVEAHGPAYQNNLFGGPTPRAAYGLDVTCWCETKIFRLSVEDVRDGVTRRCGRPGCQPP